MHLLIDSLKKKNISHSTDYQFVRFHLRVGSNHLHDISVTVLEVIFKNTHLFFQFLKCNQSA